MSSLPGPGEPPIVLEDARGPKGDLWPYQELCNEPPGTHLQDALQRIGCRLSGRDQLSAIGVPQSQSTSEDTENTRTARLLPCKYCSFYLFRPTAKARFSHRLQPLNWTFDIGDNDRCSSCSSRSGFCIFRQSTFGSHDSVVEERARIPSVDPSSSPIRLIQWISGALPQSLPQDPELQPFHWCMDGTASWIYSICTGPSPQIQRQPLVSILSAVAKLLQRSPIPLRTSHQPTQHPFLPLQRRTFDDPAFYR